MIKTQVYFTDDQSQMIDALVSQKGIKKSKLIRWIVDEGIKKVKNVQKKKSAVDGLIAMAEDAKRQGLTGPRDLSENIDEYLYGSKSEYVKR